MKNLITRRVHIEFISKDTVVVTNAYLQKTFHLDKMFVPNKVVYIDLVKMNTINDYDSNIDRFLASIAKNPDGGCVLDIIARPDYYGDWQRVGTASIGLFEYYMKGGLGFDPNTVKTAEGTFSVKIIY